MCTTREGLRKFLPLIWLMLASAAVRAEPSSEHVSLWAGGGVGAMLAGEGAAYVNGHKMGALAVTLPGAKIRLRLAKGSLERTRGIQSGTGDNDLDYQGFDIVIARAATNLPIDLAIGAARYEEAYHIGYPDHDFGGSLFVHRWGPHVSALRSSRFAPYFEGWFEVDLHYIPYDSRQTAVFLDIGLGARL